MAENKMYMQRYAMLSGTYMGVFWILKFALFPLGLRCGLPFLTFLFAGLTLCVPFLGYRYLKAFRDQACGGAIGFFAAWVFTVSMYVFSSMLTAVAHYVYFRFVDHGFLFDTYEHLLAGLAASNVPGMEAYLKQLAEALEAIRGLSPTDITFQLMSQNVFYCSLLALPTALFAMRRRKGKAAG